MAGLQSAYVELRWALEAERARSAQLAQALQAVGSQLGGQRPQCPRCRVGSQGELKAPVAGRYQCGECGRPIGAGESFISCSHCQRDRCVQCAEWGKLAHQIVNEADQRSAVMVAKAISGSALPSDQQPEQAATRPSDDDDGCCNNNAEDNRASLAL